MKTPVCIALTVSFALCGSAVGGTAIAQSASARPKVSCASLVGMKIAASRIRLPTRGATIISAAVREAEGHIGTPNHLPQYCDVRGEIAPVDPDAGTIKFGVALPTEWNGNAMQIGGNGMLGFIPWLAALNRDGAGSPVGPAYPADKPYPLALGYVTYGGDSGHKTGAGTAPGAPGGVPPSTGQATVGGAPPGPPDYSWAANRETWLNFAYEHVRKDHDAAMAVMQELYGRAPRYNYYFGESHGGRQAMEAIARYPEDYDGVFVSVPLTYLTELFMIGMRDQRAQFADGAWIPLTKLKLIEGETQRQCDELDGLKDGVVLNYSACQAKFDPATNPNAMAAVRCVGGADAGDACLADAQIKTLTTFRSPMKLPYAVQGGAREYPGQPVGSEATHNYVAARVKPDPTTATSGFIPLFRAVFGEPSLTLQDFDFERLSPKLKKMSDELDAPTDWSKFLNRGGKVIFHTASNDYTTNANAHIAALRSVERQSSAAAFRKGLRAYVTPSGDHGSRSFSFPERTPQARMEDFITVLTSWVEQDKEPPTAIVQTLTASAPPYVVTRSRPLCQYPNYPRYKGAGDPAIATSYECAKP